MKNKTKKNINSRRMNKTTINLKRIYKATLLEEYNQLSTILNSKYNIQTCIINILLVIYGIRPAFWYDCWDLNKKKINLLLHFLDRYKENGIKYKFDDGEKYIENTKVVEEGPLIYNCNILSSELVTVIENNDLANTYHSPIFGKILGYTCPLDIYNNKIRKDFIGIQYNIQYNSSRIDNLYGFFCLRYTFKKKYNSIITYRKQLEKFVRKMNNNYDIIVDFS